MEWCLGCHREPERHLRPARGDLQHGWTPPGRPARAGQRTGQEEPHPGPPALRLLHVPPMTIHSRKTRRPRPDRDPGPPGREERPALLAEPRGAGRDRGVPGVPPPRVPEPGVGVDRPDQPPDLPPADGGVAGPGGRERVLGPRRPRRSCPTSGSPRRSSRASRSTIATAVSLGGYAAGVARREPHGPPDDGRGERASTPTASARSTRGAGVTS